MFTPIPLQRIEGLILLVGAVIVFSTTGTSWWWFAVLLLAPDLSMVGYLANPRTGAAVYNAGHSMIGPGLLFGWSWLGGPDAALWVGAIWLAHIGMDRLFGYGLKLADDFQHTHLGWVGRQGSTREP